MSSTRFDRPPSFTANGNSGSELDPASQPLASTSIMSSVASNLRLEQSSSLKRQRREADDVEPDVAPVPSPSFFFADGDVVLFVETTLYKLHRFLLSKASVFEDTLLVGSDSLAGGRLEPIRLPGDRARDWDVFLRAMYDGL